MKAEKQFVAFLRGINVGGHHKVPMAALKNLLEKNGFSTVKTLLNSGNIIFSSTLNADKAEVALEKLLTENFKFPIPAIVREAAEIAAYLEEDPFKKIKAEDHLHFYISFLKKRSRKGNTEIKIEGLKIIRDQDDMICCVMDKTKLQSTKGMELLDKYFDKSVTTRNWNTIRKIGALLNPIS